MNPRGSVATAANRLLLVGETVWTPILDLIARSPVEPRVLARVFGLPCENAASGPRVQHLAQSASPDELFEAMADLRARTVPEDQEE